MPSRVIDTATKAGFAADESLFERAARVIEESARLREEVQRSLAQATRQSARLIRSSEVVCSPAPVADTPGHRVLWPVPPHAALQPAEGARAAGAERLASWPRALAPVEIPAPLCLG